MNLDLAFGDGTLSGLIKQLFILSVEGLPICIEVLLKRN